MIEKVKCYKSIGQIKKKGLLAPFLGSNECFFLGGGGVVDSPAVG
jgi:hypothetical protein